MGPPAALTEPFLSFGNNLISCNHGGYSNLLAAILDGLISYPCGPSWLRIMKQASCRFPRSICTDSRMAPR